MGKLLPPEQQHLYKRIDEILWQDWDPIGINDSARMRDEYYGYLPEVFHLALERADANRIADYLFHVEVDKMGMAGDYKKCLRVARTILDIHYET